MARNEFFAKFKDERLSGAAGVGRKIGHSFANYFQSMDRTTVGIKAGMDPRKDGVKAFGLGTTGGAAINGTANLSNATANVLGAGGMAAGIVIMVGGAAASAAAIAALSGPQAAITAGVIGIVLVAKSTYSNREQAHMDLTKFCWSLIDDESPRESFISVEKLTEASGAALTLMDDGKSQIKLLASKLDAAKAKIDTLHAKLAANENVIKMIRPDRATGQYSAGDTAKVRDLKLQSEKLIEEAQKQGGAIYEYARRMVHTGNYIQAPHIVALAMKEKHSPGSVVGVAQGDYFANTELGRNARKFFTDAAAAYDMITTAPAQAPGGQGHATAPMSMPQAPTVARTPRRP